MPSKRDFLYTATLGGIFQFVIMETLFKVQHAPLVGQMARTSATYLQE